MHNDLDVIRNNAVTILSSEIDSFTSVVVHEAHVLNKLEDFSDSAILKELRAFPKPESMLRAHLLLNDGTFYSNVEDTILHYDPTFFSSVINKDRIGIAAPRYSDPLNQIIVEISAPIYRDGERVGILVGCYDIQAFEALLSNRFLQGDCTISIVSNVGTLISRSAIQPRPNDYHANIFSYYRSESISFLSSSLGDMMQNMSQKRSGDAAYETNGTTFYLSYTPLQIRNWYLMAETSEKTLSVQSGAINRYAVELAFGVVFVILSVAVFISICRAREHAEIRRLLVETATIDPLTKTFNRSATEARIQAFLDAPPESGLHALFMVDIDGFKSVNDRLGHIAGDQLLSTLGAQLQKIFCHGEIVGRIGGDEFMILIPNAPDQAYIRHLAGQLCRAFVCTFPSPEPEGETVRVSASVGISLHGENGVTFRSLYAQADQALYYCKNTGRNRYSFATNGADSTK